MRATQAKTMRFLSIKIPKSAARTSGDVEVTDHISTMKNNLELMSQVYKNLYSLYKDDRQHKHFGQEYAGIEMYIEKEVIKFLVIVPAAYITIFDKMIASFYAGAVIEAMAAPKLMDAGKYIDGGEITLTKESAYPIKTYETFEADPMDSILAAYSKIDVDERLSLQILISPLNEHEAKTMRKRIEDIKEDKET